MRETLDIIDRASIIHAGEVLFEGIPDEIVADPEVRRVRTGRPVYLNAHPLFRGIARSASRWGCRSSAIVRS